ncbi:hypothetical protein MEO39_27210, partial [Dolichospermum sp. ST_sed2]|nr:hypothetical protein [Dolichospermum sp. ST_sed2]
MNRTGETQNLGHTDLEAQGAVPISFTKPVNIRYTPNLIQALNVNASSTQGQVNQAIGSTPVFNRWL